MGIFRLSIESPSGSGSFVPTGRTVDEAAVGAIASFLPALNIASGQTFTAAMVSGTAAATPAVIQQPTSAQQASANAMIAAGAANGALVIGDAAAANQYTDPAGNLLAYA